MHKEAKIRIVVKRHIQSGNRDQRLTRTEMEFQFVLHPSVGHYRKSVLSTSTAFISFPLYNVGGTSR